MHIQIIYCHPSESSYTYDILKQLKSHLDRENIEYKISDLYKIGFQTDLSEEEYAREGFANTELPILNDIKEEHKKIKYADCMIFLYPVWWSDCPAKMKGWFDRVFTVGYAYGNSNTKDSDKMKIVPYGLVLCTAGHPNQFLKQIGIEESMRNVMLDDRLGQRFENKEMIILGGTIDKEKVKLEHSAVIESIGKRIKKYCSPI